MPGFSRSLIVTLLVSLSTVVHAAETERQKPTVQITTAVAYPFSLKSGQAFPPSLAHGLGVLVPGRKGWGYYSEFSVVTGFTEFRPGFQVVSGPMKKLTKGFALGLSALYKIAPTYEPATSPTHMMGGAIVPVLPLSFGSVSFPLGFACNVKAHDPTLALNVKVALRLPKAGAPP